MIFTAFIIALSSPVTGKHLILQLMDRVQQNTKRDFILGTARMPFCLEVNVQKFKINLIFLSPN